MRYALLIHVDESIDRARSEQEMHELMAAYEAFGGQYRDKITGGDALQPISTATTVRVRDNKTMTTDGPFAETKEQLNGFYIVNVDNLDEATEMASHIPGAKNGSIEVRPIFEFS